MLGILNVNKRGINAWLTIINRKGFIVFAIIKTKFGQYCFEVCVHSVLCFFFLIKSPPAQPLGYDE